MATKKAPVKKKCAAKKTAPKGKIVKVAVIGCGARGAGVVKNLLRDSNRCVKVISAYDPDKAQCERAMSKEIWDQPDMKICSSYQEAIAVPGVECATGSRTFACCFVGYNGGKPFVAQTRLGRPLGRIL